MKTLVLSILFTFSCIILIGQNADQPCFKPKPWAWPPYVQTSCKFSIDIDPTLPPTTSSIPGLELIFTENFSTSSLNQYWGASEPGNGEREYNDPLFCTVPGKAIMNKENIYLENGNLKIEVWDGEVQDECEYSGGDAKSFGVPETQGNDHQWFAPIGSYIEVRTKIGFCEGLGGAFWLFGPGPSSQVSELDVLELYGRSTRRHEFQGNFWFGPSYEDPSLQQLPVRISVFNKITGGKVILDNQYLNWGVYFDQDKAQFYLNNELYYEINYRYDHQGNYLPLKIPREYTVINSAAHALLNLLTSCNNLPNHYLVDYVQLYTADNFKATNFHKATTNGEIIVCDAFNGGENIFVNYIPDATYSWTGPFDYFEFANVNPTIKERSAKWYLKAKGTNPPAPGNYSFTLTTTYQSGHTESLQLIVKVLAGVPSAPSIELFSAGNEYIPGIIANSEIENVEYSLDNGVTWFPGNFASGSDYVFFNSIGAEPNPQYINYCVRIYNNCGSSQTNCETITIPSTGGCSPCFHTPVAPIVDTIILIDNSLDSTFTLSISSQDSVQSYLWSLDSLTWLELPNNDSLNQLVGISQYTSDFHVYVRSKTSNDLSRAYSQFIDIGNNEISFEYLPDSTGNNYNSDKQPSTINQKYTSEHPSENGVEEVFYFIVYSIDGKEIERKKLLNPISTSDFTLNDYTEININSGVYFIALFGQNNQFISTDKIILID